MSQVEAQRKGGGVLDMSPLLIKAIWRLAIWAVQVEMPTAAYAVISAGTACGPALNARAEK
jgi:hypothetical protein